MPFFQKNTKIKDRLPTEEEATAGRNSPIISEAWHPIFNCSLRPPYPPEYQQAIFGLGCFWGAERLFWKISGVAITAVGYAGGITLNPTYEEVCSGWTGHNEVVLVVFNPIQVTYNELLAAFWANHDPTQGFKQGNDQGTQYRSGLYCFTQEQQELAECSKEKMARAFYQAKWPRLITTEIQQNPPFYFAEDYHQQYLAKNPQGYCGLKGTGVSCFD